MNFLHVWRCSFWGKRVYFLYGCTCFGVGDWSQGFKPSKRVLFHWSTFPAPGKGVYNLRQILRVPQRSRCRFCVSSPQLTSCYLGQIFFIYNFSILGFRNWSMGTFISTCYIMNSLLVRVILDSLFNFSLATVMFQLHWALLLPGM